MPAPHPITGEASRALRGCAGCDVVDTGPRCVSAAVVGQEPPPPWHHDCHAAVGCRTCIAIVRASGGVKDDELLAFKVSLQAPDGPWLVVDHHTDGGLVQVAHHAHPEPTSPPPAGTRLASTVLVGDVEPAPGPHGKES